jgi:hypothetical protein
VVSLSQLLDGLAVGDVADEEAQLIQMGDVLGDSLEAGQEEIADGKVGSDAIGQEVIDLGSQLPCAVVYDVVGHLVFLIFLLNVHRTTDPTETSEITDFPQMRD